MPVSILEAACLNRVTAVLRLLRERADPNEVGYGGQTPLAFAARHGEGDCVSELIKANADVCATDLVNSTPLHEAAGAGHAEVTLAPPRSH